MENAQSLAAENPRRVQVQNIFVSEAGIKMLRLSERTGSRSIFAVRLAVQSAFNGNIMRAFYFFVL